ncbi:VOC family protein [Enterovirga rhinocerotis]|uniref:Catechol 2,3-dioxygenase-like lactoylglutathione lyase family enzyme n=1 Tax=Enterovirga rhinocerotis TaxID=1339210 RepID=A0A4R7BQW8_9HYPH|nr:VOC family protein [Enterovirga rhinocerotis]TDR88028.1 catechol 2,3-dioxygenase-like lactoylglutathione lyase family enzyme [Enterovirga rhinocerotis]
MPDAGSPSTPLLAGLIVRAHHVALGVADFDGAVGFLRDVIGMRLLGEIDHRREEALDRMVGLPEIDVHWAMLELSGFHVELFHYYHPAGRPVPIRQCDHGLTHLCFEVYDLALVHERLEAAGYHANAEPLEVRGGRAKGIYVTGPEGIVVEFAELSPWRSDAVA